MGPTYNVEINDNVFGSEPEFLEEVADMTTLVHYPLVLWKGTVFGLHYFTNSASKLFCSLAVLAGLLEMFFLEQILEIEVCDLIPGGHKMAMIDILDKNIDPCLPLDFFFGHAPSHLAASLLQPYNKTVRIPSSARSILIAFDDECLLACKPAVQHDHNTAWLIACYQQYILVILLNINYECYPSNPTNPSYSPSSHCPVDIPLWGASACEICGHLG